MFYSWKTNLCSMHDGLKQLEMRHQISVYHTSEQKVCAAQHASKASSAEQTNEWAIMQIVWFQAHANHRAGRQQTSRQREKERKTQQLIQSELECIIPTDIACALTFANTVNVHVFHGTRDMLLDLKDSTYVNGISERAQLSFFFWTNRNSRFYDASHKMSKVSFLQSQKRASRWTSRRTSRKASRKARR